MNWNRILNVFILIFMVLNIGIFLIDIYYEESKYSLSKERQDLLDEVFYSKNIGIIEYLPNYYPKAPLLLSSQIDEIDRIVDNLMGDEVYQVVESEIEKQYISDTVKIVMIKSGENNGVISYESNGNHYVPETLTDKDIEKVVKRFIKDITLSENEFIITGRGGGLPENDDEYTFQFNEVYKDEVLFCSYVNLKISEEGIKQARSMRFEPIEFDGNEKEIYPIDEALYDFLETMGVNENNTNINITKIELGYDLNEDVEITSDNIEAIPYYRITLSNSSDLINAYTLK